MERNSPANAAGAAISSRGNRRRRILSGQAQSWVPPVVPWLLQALQINRLEIYRRQIHRGKSRVTDDAGHRLASIGVEYVRAGGRKERFEIRFRKVADLENAS